MSLESIPGIGGSTRKRLEEQGIETIEDLATADSDDISVPTGNAQTLVMRAKQSAVVSKSAADLLDEFDNASYISTGIPKLDEVMGGGWESATIGVVYGKSGKGKSQLAFSTMADAAAEGSVVYIQTEMQSKSVAQRLADLAGDTQYLENITFYEAYGVEEQFSTYEKVAEEHDDIDLLVIDSFTAQFRMTDDFSSRSDLGERSTVMGRHLNRLGELARSYDIPILMTGQVYPQPDAYGKGDVLWGGEKMRHFVSFFVRMSEGQGELKKATLENHPGRAEDEVLININEEGIDGIDSKD